MTGCIELFVVVITYERERSFSMFIYRLADVDQAAEGRWPRICNTIA
jgi:hypothetical protein